MKGRGGFIKGRGQIRTGLPILPPSANVNSRGIHAPSTGYGVPTFAPRIGRIVNGVRVTFLRPIFGRRR